jgi:hypothetical protein
MRLGAHLRGTYQACVLCQRSLPVVSTSAAYANITSWRTHEAKCWLITSRRTGVPYHIYMAARGVKSIFCNNQWLCWIAAHGKIRARIEATIESVVSCVRYNRYLQYPGWKVTAVVRGMHVSQQLMTTGVLLDDYCFWVDLAKDASQL